MVQGYVQVGTRVVPGCQGGAKCHYQYCECLCKPFPTGEIRAAFEKPSLHGVRAVEPNDRGRAGRSTVLRLEGEHHLGAKEGHHLVAGVVVAREKEFAPEVAGHVTAEFIFEDALEIVAAEGAGGGEGTITQAFQGVKITSRRGVVGK